MMFWIFAAAIVAVSLFFLLRALASPAAMSGLAAGDIAFFRSQQDEIARQLKAGMIDQAESRAAETEAARKLLARTREDVATPVFDARRSRMTQLAVALALPLIGLPLYLYLGAPELPAQPIASRTDINRSEKELARLVDRLEAHLAEAPEDMKGLEIAFPVYMRLGRFDNAADVATRLNKLRGPSADGFARLAEAQVFAASGVVSDEAGQNIARALAIDPGHARARFYSGLVAEQAGDPEKALAIWRDLAQTLTDGPERRAVAAQIARLAPPAGPQGAGADAIRNLKPEDQKQAIQGMVNNLEARLKADGGTIEEWQRLLRALTVIGEKDRAQAALAAARTQLADNADALATLGKLAGELGLPEGARP